MDSLHQIIRSLTPSEKRYFKVFASAFKEKSDSVNLFNAIDAQDDYNEEKLKKKTGIKKVTEKKSELRKLLFKVMRNYREDSGVYQQLRDAMADVEFLLSKGFNEEARKEIHKAWKLAQGRDSNCTPEMLFRLGDIHYLTLKPDKLAPDFEALHQMMDTAFAKQQDLYYALLFNFQVGAFVNTINYDEQSNAIKYLDGLIERMEARYVVAQSPRAQSILLTSIAACYMVTARLDLAVEVYARIQKLFNNNPSLTAIYPDSFLAFLTNYCMAASNNIKHKTVAKELIVLTEESFITFKNFYDSSPATLAYSREHLTTNKLVYAKTNNDWTKFDRLEAEVRERILQPGDNQKSVMALQTAVLTACFYQQKKYQKVLDWITPYYNLEGAKTFKPLMVSMRMLEMLAHYFLQQNEISYTKAENLYKTLSEQKLTDTYYRLLSTLLRKINRWNMKDKADKKEVEALRLQFLKLKECNDQKYALYSDYFEPAEILNGLINA